MNSRRLALGVLLAAGLLGLLGDLLFSGQAVGANVTLWVAAAGGAWLILARRAPPSDLPPRWLLVPLIVAAAGFSWRSDPMLRFLDAVAIGLTLMAAAAPLVRSTGRVLGAECRDLLAGLARGVGAVVVGPFVVLISLKAADQEAGSGRGMRVAVATAKGLLLALPLTILFGGLLVGADARFESLVQGVFAVPFEDLFPHLFRIGMLSWPMAGILYFALESPKVTSLESHRFPSLGTVEVTTILTVLNLLFVTFVAVQGRNLFAGNHWISTTEGATYADYARRGFFQLVAVCTLSLPVLLVLARSVEGDPAAIRRYRPLARLQVGLLMLILASAVHRLWLYVGQYGLSLDRLHASAALFTIGVTLIWFVATVLREQPGRFLRGALVAGSITLGTMHLINPAAVVVRSWVARGESGIPIDAEYLASLGNDAIPSLIAALPELDQTDRTALLHGLACNWEPPTDDPRAWSVSRAAAQRAWAKAPALESCVRADH